MSEEGRVREGESVSVAINGVDKDGQVMSRLVWTTYGYKNVEANEFAQGAVEKMLEYAREISIKKGQNTGELPGPR